MIFEILSKITLDIIRYLSIFVKSRPLQDFDIIRYLYLLLTDLLESQTYLVDYLHITRYCIDK